MFAFTLQKIKNISQWSLNFFCNIQEKCDCFSIQGLAVESVCFHTLFGSNQLTGANNWQNGLFKREMGPGGPPVITRMFVSPGKPAGENFVAHFFLSWRY